jgi:hypothetical protein
VQSQVVSSDLLDLFTGLPIFPSQLPVQELSQEPRQFPLQVVSQSFAQPPAQFASQVPVQFPLQSIEFFSL